MLKNFALSLTAIAVVMFIVFGLPATENISAVFFANYLLIASTVLWVIVLLKWLQKP